MGIDGGRADCLWLHTEANRGRDVGHNKFRHRIRWQVLGPTNGEHIRLGLRGDDNRGITISNRTNMTNNKQQTAVEWFAMKLAEKLGMPNAISFYVDNEKEILQAKEMEKRQIVDAWSNGFDEDDRATSNPFKYYNETYGGGEQ